MRHRAAVTAVCALVTAVFAGCVSVGPSAPPPGGDGDPALAAASAEAYLRRFPDAEDRAEVLYRLALLRAAPAGPAADRERAVELLERLLTEHPESADAAAARVLLAAARRSEELEAELAAREAERDAALARLDELAALVSSKDAEAAARESEAAAQAEMVARMAAELAAARAELEDSRALVARLEGELEQLKKIDLESPP